MKSRRELKALLLAGVATLSLMSGCSKNNSEEGKSNESNYGYYVLVEGELIEIENVRSVSTSYRPDNVVELVFEDGTYMRVPVNDFYKIDKNSESQQEFIRKLTK